MAYGVKRGVKPAGEYNTADITGLALASAAGIVSALVTDYNQKGEASAIYTINQWAAQASQIFSLGDPPLWAVVLTIIGVGAGSVFYFQPITRQGAFAQGFGLLAVLMTAVPADLAGGLEAIATRELPSSAAPTTPADAPVGGGAPGVVEANFTTAIAREGEARVVAVQNQQQAIYDVVLTITFPNGLPDDVESMIRKGTLRGRLHNQGTGETFNLFRTAGGYLQRQGNSLIISAGVPASTASAELWVRVEADKYRIEVQSRKATVGQRVDWRIQMQPDPTPLFMQRLGKSYWF
jgi:hypothetical protein